MPKVEIVVRGGNPGDVAKMRSWSLTPDQDVNAVFSKLTAVMNGIGAPLRSTPMADTIKAMEVRCPTCQSLPGHQCYERQSVVLIHEARYVAAEVGVDPWN